MTDQTQSEKTYTIVRLFSRNYMNLCAEGLEICPNRPVVTICGKNDEGKSAVLGSIFGVLTGKLPARPVRKGAQRAETECDMGEFVAKLVVPDHGAPRLTLRSKDGADIRSPRTLLQSYSNEILLDPVGFIRLGATAEGRRKQLEMVRKLPGLNLDFSTLNAERQQSYDERTAVSRDLATAQGKLTNYPADPNAPAEEVKVADLLQEQQRIMGERDAALRAAREQNERNAGVKRDWQECANVVKVLMERMDDKAGEIIRLEEALQKAKAEKATLEAQVAAATLTLKEREQVVAGLVYADESVVRAAAHAQLLPINDRLAQADDLNTKVRQQRRRKEIQGEIAGFQDKVDRLTARLAEIDAQKQRMVSDAKFPVDGLTFDESGLLLDGLPLSEDQQSRAKILTTAIAIGFAFKPRIPVVLFRDASILDSESRSALAGIVEAQGGQIWEEIVSQIGPDGKPIPEPFSIVIEDGRVAN